MMEKFVFKGSGEVKEQGDESIDRSFLFENYEAKNGGAVFPRELALEDSEKMKSLPLAYMAFPLTGKENMEELGKLSEAINLLENNPEDYNPFHFSINYDVLEKVDEDGRKSRVVLFSEKEKIKVAQKAREEAIAFVERWAKEENRKTLYELFKNKKDNMEIQKATDELDESIEESYRILKSS